ncbi:TnsA endonuclease N-terminal domain-containing protein [Desulfotomaculum sp. 1211_IL3151]|uniref:TnsA endonuclease N-terminal domain-containing protein n=1 Tax=Desulfotomaculum sp. 1211_IL3151 TaxID=3084055 RepID=UPI002FDA3CC0
MEFTPCRKVVRRKGNIKRVGYFPSMRLNRLVEFESLLECDYIHLLEFDKCGVVSFCEQPVEIEYIENGKTKHYYPDFAVELPEDKIEIVEIKPSRKLNDPKLYPKILAAQNYCESMGYEYLMVTEKQFDPVTLRNIKILFSYRNINVTASQKLLIRQTIGVKETVNVHTLAERISLQIGSYQDALVIIYSLLYHQYLSFDISQPLSSESIIRLPSKEVL